MFLLDLLCFEPPFRFTRSMMRRFATARNAYSFLAESEAGPPDLQGFLTVQMGRGAGKSDGYVVTLDVNPRVRRQGVASRLLTAAEAEAARRGGVRMGLHVWAENIGAIRFYERAGYTRTLLHPDFYASGSHAFGYRKVLGEAMGEPSQREALSQRA